MFDVKKPYIIAEISGNHNGSFKRAKTLIKSASENGAHCVKLQTYTADTMTIKSNKKDFQINEGLWKNYSLWDLYNWAHTPFEWHKELFEYAKECGIDCISTPFDETAVDLLEDLDTPFYKIASFEITDIPLIEYVASKNKPMLISTGMANYDEIYQALEVVKRFNIKEYVLFHCVSGYPTPIEESNINTIHLLREKFQCNVGLSDHTLGETAPLAAIALGANIIEKHFTLSRSEEGPDSAFSMEPHELRDLRLKIDETFKSLGKGSFDRKKSEESNVPFRRSIYAVEDINKGQVFTKKNIRRIRPGYGLSPRLYNKLLGTVCISNLTSGDPISDEDIDLD